MSEWNFNETLDDRWVNVSDVAIMMKGNARANEAAILRAVEGVPPGEQRDAVFQPASRQNGHGSGSTPDMVRQSFVLDLIGQGVIEQKPAPGNSTARLAVKAGTSDNLPRGRE